LVDHSDMKKPAEAGKTEVGRRRAQCCGDSLNEC
jgi:hypothetical protein